jgi:hypothetical protein
MAHFVPLHDQLMDGVIKAREQEKLTKSEALKAMDCCHEVRESLAEVQANY